MKKRILHVITTLSVGGAEIHLRELLSGLSREKYDLELAFFKEEAQEARSMVDDFRRLGLPVHDLRGGGRFSPGALLRLTRLIRNNRYDLVHSHLFRADLYASLALSCFPSTILVNSVHNPEDFYTKPLVAFLARLAALRQQQTIVISRAVADHLATYLKTPRAKLSLVYYGLKPRSRTGINFRQKYGIPADVPLIGTVGRLSKQKGHFVLIKAMALVCRELPRARLLIIGHDDQGLKDGLLARIREAGLEENIILGGFRDEIPDIMACFGVFCLPSLWEGFGMVLIEAMAESKPIVASRVGSIPEVVEDGRTGLLIPPGDENQLAAALLRLLRDKDLAAAMGRAGKERLEKHFTRRAMAESTERIYDRLLSEAEQPLS